MTTLKSGRRFRLGSMEVLVGILLACAFAASTLRNAVLDSAALSTVGTVFCGVFVQAVPFLVLGVVVSGLIAVFVSPERLARWLPRRPAVAVVAAGIGGAALPGCECGSVPLARRLFGDGGATGAAALTFMLAAPAINPVVLAATAVAFPGAPQMVFARLGASLLTAVVMGWVWSRWGRPEWITRRLPTAGAQSESRWVVFAEAARHDFLQAASYLVVGAGAAALLHVVVPQWVFSHLASDLILGVALMAVLAVVLALCSEADAFVAASMTMVPLLPRLVFLVVGPAVDVKLFAMQAGMFGRAFAARFAPCTFLVATASACAVGLFVLGGR
ncbi:permease [Mycobacterium sp. 852002-40037_SCH5390672]|uniref:permease n=1 Tax=Mycobacterium sp. 852002-40037_SCH5390672 TaxID=1834089 RepID=UPI000804BBDE|nr:permease [Mycobacterium sp. 852002-40037_SCH5390672]OBB90262.1 hypothetical protein A5782_16585 [Mycobacterium sp. 852002-40037_SCH5390672]